MQNIYEGLVICLGSFTLMGVISLKVQVGKILAKISESDEHTKNYRQQTHEDIREIRNEMKEVWKAIGES